MIPPYEGGLGVQRVALHCSCGALRHCQFKGGILFPKRIPFLSPHEGVGMAAPMTLHGAKGGFSHVRECPLSIPQENGRGVSTSPLHP